MVRGALVGLSMWAATSVLLGAPPRVIDASPNVGDVGVDPATREIRVVFDQEMSPRGRSICGGGPEFPTVSGQGRWENSRTFVLQVTLRPGQRYWLSINCPSSQNFKSTAGESAEPAPITFRTAAEGEAPAAVTEAEAAAAVDKLRAAIDERYSYRDRLNIDWDQRFAEHGPALRAARTPGALARAAAKLLEAAQDLHIGVTAGDLEVPVFRARVTPNADPALITKTVPGLSSPSPRVMLGRFADGVGYIAIHSWSREQGETQLKPALDAIERFADAPGLIVDVRLNGGGDEVLARAFAARFVETERVYSRSRIRDAKAEGGWLGPFDRVVAPAKDAPVFRGRVAVLIGPQCMSSNESFIKMMQQPGKRELFGQNTFGSSGNPQPHALGGQVTVRLPSWQDLDEQGRMLEGVGIAPDHMVPWPKDKPASDPVIDAALAWLRKP